jgi:hypothetical protein
LLEALGNFAAPEVELFAKLIDVLAARHSEAIDGVGVADALSVRLAGPRQKDGDNRQTRNS